MGTNLAQAVHFSLDYPDRDPASKTFFNHLAGSHKLASGIAYLAEDPMFVHTLGFHGYELRQTGPSKFERTKKVKKKSETAKPEKA